MIRVVGFPSRARRSGLEHPVQAISSAILDWVPRASFFDVCSGVPRPGGGLTCADSRTRRVCTRDPDSAVSVR